MTLLPKHPAANGAGSVARRKILAAAAEVAREQGAGNISLDAVAARAGVSKGGLLYHFPSKAALMRAAVEGFVAEFDARMDEGDCCCPADFLAKCVQLTVSECAKKSPGSSAGVLAAIAEDPDFLKPIEEHKRRLLDRMLAASATPSRAMLVYLALEGLRSIHLFDSRVLTPQEYALALEALLAASAEPA